MANSVTDDLDGRPAPPLLVVEVLGQFRWALGTTPLPEPSAIGKAAITYLLVHAGESVDHDEMEAVFAEISLSIRSSWEDELRQLQRLVPEPILCVTHGGVRLTGLLRSDLHEAIDLADSGSRVGDLQRAWLLLRSPLLEGLELRHLPIWNVWLGARRAQLHRRLRLVTERLGARALEPDVRGRRRSSEVVH